MRHQVSVIAPATGAAQTAFAPFCEAKVMRSVGVLNAWASSLCTLTTSAGVVPETSSTCSAAYTCCSALTAPNWIAEVLPLTVRVALCSAVPRTSGLFCAPPLTWNFSSWPTAAPGAYLACIDFCAEVVFSDDQFAILQHLPGHFLCLQTGLGRFVIHHKLEIGIRDRHLQHVAAAAGARLAHIQRQPADGLVCDDAGIRLHHQRIARANRISPGADDPHVQGQLVLVHREC